MPNHPPKSLAEQAVFVQGLCERTWFANRQPADTTYLHLSQDDVASLEALASGLEMLAIYDEEIKLAIMAERRRRANA